MKETKSSTRRRLQRFVRLLDKILFWLPEIKPLIAWYDLWVGFYWNHKERKLYVLPLPCLGWVLDWSQTKQPNVES